MTLTQKLGYGYISGGSVGLLFSFLITLEKLALVVDPSHIPPCNISPFISCGTVMQTAQASLFGFPNSFIGIIGFSIVITIGFAILSQAQFARWFWRGAQIGLSLACLFVFWLFYQSVYVIGTLCPYCMVVWAVTLPLFVFTTYYMTREKHLSLGKYINQVILRYPGWILAGLYGYIIIAITIQFWSYWKGLF